MSPILEKRGEHGGQSAERGRQKMFPEVPNEVRKTRQGRKHKKGGTLGQEGLFGVGTACQDRAFRTADLPSFQPLHSRQTLTFSATLSPWVTLALLPAPHPSRIGGGGSFSLTLLVGEERALDIDQIHGREGQETQRGPGPG